jgi:hypothetical protein
MAAKWKGFTIRQSTDFSLKGNSLMEETIARLLQQLEPLSDLMVALHTRTMLRELWDVLHAIQASTLDENTEGWLQMVTVVGSKINVLIDLEIQSICDAALLANGDFEQPDTPINLEDRRSNAQREAKLRRQAADREKFKNSERDI